MEQLKKDILKARNIKLNTLKAYTNNYKVLAKEVGKSEFKSLELFKKYDEIIEYLKKKPLSSQKNKIASIIVALKTKPQIYKDVLKKYEDKLFEINETYDEVIAKNKKTLRESENWVSLDELKEVWNYYKKQVYAMGIHKSTEISKKERQSLQNFVICSLYILQEPRRNRDYSECRFIKKKIFDELSQQEKDDNNYLVYHEGKVLKFSFSDYKSSKKFGNQVYNIPAKLRTVLNMWVKFKSDKQEYLLLNNRGDKLSSNSLTKHLWSIFSITGKNKIGATMLRHIYVTDDEDLKDYRAKRDIALKKATKMSHSLKMQNNYYRKD